MARVIILGIGNDLRGDDGIGPTMVKFLNKEIKNPDVKIIDCGVVPENFLSKIESFKPKKVIIIDAIDANKVPGTIHIIKELSNNQLALSTHRVPLSIMVEYLKKTAKVEVVLIGVQVKNTEFGSEMSNEVRVAVKEIANKTKDLLK